jgi:hypothetical protein
MAQFTNTSGEDREIPWIGRLVLAGESFEVPADLEDAFTRSADFTKSKAKKADENEGEK